MSDTQAGAPMAKPPGLRQRGKSWEMRVRVPQSLHGLLPTERVRSFGAISFKDACRLGWDARAEIERQFEEAELKLGLAAKRLLLPIAPKFTEAELIVAAHRYLSECEGGTSSIPLHEVAQAKARDSAVEEAFYLSRPEALDDAGIHTLAEDFAERQGYQLPPGAERYPFLEAIQAALIEHLNRLIARLDGATISTINPGFAGVEPSIGETNSMTMMQAVEMYIAAPARSSNARSSQKMDRSRLGVLRDIVGGDRPVDSITKADLRDYVEQLLKLPANYTKLFPGKSPSEAITASAASGAKTLSAASVERGVQAAKSLFAWLEREDIVVRNPAQHLQAPKTPSKSSRRSFEPVEMRALLDATAPEGNCQRDWTYWSVRIAMLHGLRFTEPLGFKVHDLVELNGIWTFRIRTNEFRSLKTGETARDVPVHPRLIELGVLELKEGRDPEERLIRGAPWNEKMRFNAAQKHMGRIIRRDVSPDPDLVFHSLRHSFRDAMRDGSFPRSVEERLGGWKAEAGSVMEGYGRGHRLEVLREWIAKVGYRGVVIE